MHIRFCLPASLAVLVASAALLPAAHADTLSFSNTTVVDYDGNASPLTGYITLSSGAVTGGQIMTEGATLNFSQYDPEKDSGLQQIGPDIEFRDTSGNFVEIYLHDTAADGPSDDLCTSAAPCSYSISSGFAYDVNSYFADAAYDEYRIASGTLVPAVSATPEPSSLALAATGVMGVAWMLRRRINATNCVA